MTALSTAGARVPAQERVRTITARELGAWAPAWDALASAAPKPSPFLLSWWLEAHADAGDPGAGFVLVLDADRLIGGLAVQVDRLLGIRRVRLLGAGPLAPDHLDLVAAPDRRAEVVAAVARWLSREPSYLDLAGLVEGALVLDALPSGALVTVLSSAPYLALPPTTDGPIKPRRRAREAKRNCGRLEKEGATFHVETGRDPVALERSLVSLRARHVDKWGEQSGVARAYSLFAQAARAGAAAGAVRIHEVRFDGAVVASELTLDVAGRRHRYVAGRSTEPRWAGAGGALVMHVIQGAQADGCLEIDCLRGREPYKYDWTETDRDVLRARAAQGLRPRIVVRVMGVAERGRPLGRRVKAKVRARRARTPG